MFRDQSDNDNTGNIICNNITIAGSLTVSGSINGSITWNGGTVSSGVIITGSTTAPQYVYVSYMSQDAGNAAYRAASPTTTYSLTCSYSIYSMQSVVASDFRIKKSIEALGDDLVNRVMRRVTPRKFRYHDYMKMGTENTFGFVAQELEATVGDIMPRLVSKSDGDIPTVYENRKVERAFGETGTATRTVTLVDLDPSTLEWDGARDGPLRLSLRDRDDRVIVGTVRDVVGGRVTVELDADLALPMPGEEDIIFVYGHFVADKRCVDDAQLFAVSFAAVQGLILRSDETDAKAALLDARVVELEAQVAVMEAESKKQRQDLEAIILFLRSERPDFELPSPRSRSRA